MNFKDKSYISLTLKRSKDGILKKFEKKKFRTLKNKEILVKIIYSNINFKDRLILNGNPGLVRNYPHTPGIDLAGKVVLSKSKKFRKGQRVITVGKPLGVNNDGGFSQYQYVSEKFLEKLPNHMDLKSSMIFGTAGFTAALVVLKLIKNRHKQPLKILISGASGGVGLISIFILSQLGYEVDAITSSKNFFELKKIGVKNIIKYSDFIQEGNLPLLKEKYSHIIDNLGGDIVSIGSRVLKKNGTLYLVGNAENEKFSGFTLPFILKKINLIGINTEMASSQERNNAWKLLSYNTKTNLLSSLYSNIKFKDLLKFISNKTKKKFGRIVLKIDHKKI